MEIYEKCTGTDRVKSEPAWESPSPEDDGGLTACGDQAEALDYPNIVMVCVKEEPVDTEVSMGIDKAVILKEEPIEESTSDKGEPQERPLGMAEGTVEDPLDAQAFVAVKMEPADDESDDEHRLLSNHQSTEHQCVTAAEAGPVPGEGPEEGEGPKEGEGPREMARLCESETARKLGLEQEDTLALELRAPSHDTTPPGNPYACDVCTKTFKTPSILKEHIRSHTGEKPYACESCDKRFSTLGNLKRHELIHKGEKSYSCGTCQKQFRRVNVLRDHERLHTGEKPFSCGFCEKQFTDSGNLRRHERIHTGVRPFVCKVCNKSFTGWGNLKSHERIHTGEKPYSCEVCKKEFTGLGNLRRHERIHSGVKPYACDICHQQFSQSSSLKEHIRIHTGERPYPCEICKRPFSALSSLKRHQRTHGGSSVPDFSLPHFTVGSRENKGEEFILS